MSKLRFKARTAHQRAVLTACIRVTHSQCAEPTDRLIERGGVMRAHTRSWSRQVTDATLKELLFSPCVVPVSLHSTV